MGDFEMVESGRTILLSQLDPCSRSGPDASSVASTAGRAAAPQDRDLTDDASAG